MGNILTGLNAKALSKIVYDRFNRAEGPQSFIKCQYPSQIKIDKTLINF